MVNYKRVVCEVAALFLLLSVATAAPAADCTERHYDQRQNGTENYRLNIDGVVIAVAPAESLLAAVSDLDISDFLDIEDLENFQKPKPPADLPAKPEETKPTELDKPSEPAAPAAPSINSELKGQRKDASVRKQEKAQRMKQRLANVLLPLLRKNRHH